KRIGLLVTNLKDTVFNRLRRIQSRNLPSNLNTQVLDLPPSPTSRILSTPGQREFLPRVPVPGNNHLGLGGKPLYSSVVKQQDVYLCALYIPPHDSPYFDPELFSNIETDIALFHRKGLIVLAGDFNARTGKENDFITDESGKFIPGGDIPPPPNLTKRQNFDNIVNDHGKQLLDLCKTCDLRILNGRSKGDTLGKFTFHSINGISTVDYI
ncbi:unnamed protein product, partial [Porites lobata]